MQVAIFLASLAREGSKADRADKTAFSGWMREAQKSFWTKQTSFTVWGNVLDRVIGHSNEPLLSPEGAWNPSEHTCWISDWRDKALSVSSLPPVCVQWTPEAGLLRQSSEPWPRGSIPSSSNASPRMSKKKPLGSPSSSEHRGDQEPKHCLKNQWGNISIYYTRKTDHSFCFPKVFSVVPGSQWTRGFPLDRLHCSATRPCPLPPECVFRTHYMLDSTSRRTCHPPPAEGAGSHGFNPPAVVTWATLRWLNATCWPWMYFYVNFLRKRFPNWASN